MTDIDLVLTLAERVKRLRGELQEAELELEKVVRGKTGSPPASARGSRPAARPVVSSKPTAPVTQRVAKVLVAKGPLEFGEVWAAVQPASKPAVKSALIEGRKRNQYVFRGGKYGIAGKSGNPNRKVNATRTRATSIAESRNQRETHPDV